MNDDTAILSALPAGQVPAAEAEAEEDRADSLAEELAHAAPKRWWNRGTVVLAGLVLVAGGFVGGLQAQKHWGTPATAGNFAGPNGGGGAGRNGTGGAGTGRFGGGGTGRTAAGNAAGGFGPGNAAAAPDGAAAASSGTTGTVKLVDGSTIYVQTPDGDVVTVKTDAKTAVAAASKTALKNIKAGQTVTVQGPAAADGTVTATSVTAGAK